MWASKVCVHVHNVLCSVSAPWTALVTYMCLMGGVCVCVCGSQMILPGCLAEILPVTALVWYHLEEIKSWCFIVENRRQRRQTKCPQMSNHRQIGFTAGTLAVCSHLAPHAWENPIHKCRLDLVDLSVTDWELVPGKLGLTLDNVLPSPPAYTLGWSLAGGADPAAATATTVAAKGVKGSC